MMKSEHFYLVFQPIVKISNKNTLIFEEFEVLLRSIKTQKFPANMFYELLANEQKYNQYIDWFTVELEKKMQACPDIKFSINIDVDQFQFKSTFHFLKYFSRYHEKLIIEITEHTPKNNPKLLIELDDILKKIKNHHFNIAIDDYNEGINTLFLYKKHRKYYDRIKITLFGYKSILIIIGLVIDVNIVKFLFSKKIEIVVEKIDTLRKSKIMKKLSVSQQQGYYFRTDSTLIRSFTDYEYYNNLGDQIVK